jgi:hypothetical protein
MIPFKKTLCGALAVLAMSFWVPARAAAQSWAASTGVVDPFGGSHVRFNGGIASMDSAAPVNTTVTLRYPLQEAGDLVLNTNPLQQGECRLMSVRYLVSGAGAQVTLSLKQYDLLTGIQKTLLSFDSNAHAPAPRFQTQTSVCGVFDFSFADNAEPGPSGSVYFVEAKLKRTAPNGNPQLGAFALSRNIP